MADQNIPPPASLPWFQFYYQDFLVGVSSLSMAETGAYITLLCFQWTNGSVPDDAAQRARLLRCSKRQAVAVWNGIRSKFEQGDDGAWRNLRLEAEREKQAQHRTNGAKGGFARSRGHSRPPSQDLAGGKPEPSQKLAETKPESSQALAESYPSESESESESERSKPRSALKSAPIFAPARQTGGVGAGTFPRDHLNCHPPCIRVCISEKQHAILRERHGGTDANLEAFYADVRAHLDGPVGQKPWQFWDDQFAARFAAPAVNSKTAGNVAAAARFIARGRQ